MKTLRLNPAVAGVLLLALITAGCEHKKPVLVMPQQPPPTATPQATPTPAATEAQPAEQQPQEAQPSAMPAEQPKTTEKTKSKHTHHTAAKKSGDKSEVAHNNPPKKIIPAEPVPTPQPISPGPTPSNGGNDQASTDQQARLQRKCMRARRIVFRSGSAALFDEFSALRPHGFFIFR